MISDIVTARMFIQRCIIVYVITRVCLVFAPRVRLWRHFTLMCRSEDVSAPWARCWRKSCSTIQSQHHSRRPKFKDCSELLASSSWLLGPPNYSEVPLRVWQIEAYSTLSKLKCPPLLALHFRAKLWQWYQDNSAGQVRMAPFELTRPMI